MSEVSVVFKNLMGMIARCHHLVKGQGVLVVDAANTKARWVTLGDLEDSIKKEVIQEMKKSTSECVYMLIESQDGMIHVCNCPLPEVCHNKTFTKKVTVIIVSDTEPTPLNLLCKDSNSYPKHLIEWKYGPLNTINDMIQSSKGEIIVHMENGNDYYFTNYIKHFVQSLSKGTSCVGCLSSFVYDPTSNQTCLVFEDDCGIPSMKHSMMAYTREFWENQPWDMIPNTTQRVAKFLQGRESDCMTLNPIDVMCFVEPNITKVFPSTCPCILTDMQKEKIHQMMKN